MNGKTEHKLMDLLLDQIQADAGRQHHEIEILMACLLGCVGELAALRRGSASEAGEIGLGPAETRARRILAPYLADISDSERDSFRLGGLDRAALRLELSRGHARGA